LTGLTGDRKSKEGEEGVNVTIAGRTTNNEQGKIELLSQLMLEG